RCVGAADAARVESAAVVLSPLVEGEEVGADGNVGREADLQLERVGDAADPNAVGADRAGTAAGVPHGQGRVARLALEARVVRPQTVQLGAQLADVRPGGAQLPG